MENKCVNRPYNLGCVIIPAHHTSGLKKDFTYRGFVILSQSSNNYKIANLNITTSMVLNKKIKYFCIAKIFGIWYLVIS